MCTWIQEVLDSAECLGMRTVSHTLYPIHPIKHYINPCVYISSHILIVYVCVFVWHVVCGVCVCHLCFIYMLCTVFSIPLCKFRICHFLRVFYVRVLMSWRTRCTLKSTGGIFPYSPASSPSSRPAALPGETAEK